MLDFRSLQLATASLAEALEAAKLRPDDAFVRDASIQRFEYTYELCVKSLRRAKLQLFLRDAEALLGKLMARSA